MGYMYVALKQLSLSNAYVLQFDLVYEPMVVAMSKLYLVLGNFLVFPQESKWFPLKFLRFNRAFNSSGRWLIAEPEHKREWEDKTGAELSFVVCSGKIIRFVYSRIIVVVFSQTRRCRTDELATGADRKFFLRGV